MIFFRALEYPKLSDAIIALSISLGCNACLHSIRAFTIIDHYEFNVDADSHCTEPHLVDFLVQRRQGHLQDPWQDYLERDHV